MEFLVLTAIIGIGYFAYRSGKRRGSIKGYNVGRRHGRRR